MVRVSQIVIGILLIPYLICGYYLCQIERDRKNCDSVWYYPHYYKLVQNNVTVPGPGRSFHDRFCFGGYHGLLSLIGTLLLGFTMLIYRILNGVRTRVVKYIHLMLHMITLALFSTGLWYIFIHENKPIDDGRHFHGPTSWFVFGIFCTQFIVGTLVFAYYYPDNEHTQLRMCLAPYHDVAGIWVFICCVGCCLSGKNSARIDYLAKTVDLYKGLLYVCFTIILIVIPSPYFEWDMLGPL